MWDVTGGLQWNPGAWFGAQLGTTLWMLVAAAFLAAADPAVALAHRSDARAGAERAGPRRSAPAGLRKPARLPGALDRVPGAGARGPGLTTAAARRRAIRRR
jgi:hypothetical protein